MMAVNPLSQAGFADYLELLLCSSGRKSISVARAHGFALRQTVPLADLRRSRRPKLISFVVKRLPGGQQSLGSRGIP